MRVDNLVEGINCKYNYNYDSFLGGMSKIDVECMRQSSKASAKSKKSKHSQSNVEGSDFSYIAAIMLDKIKPQFTFLENNQKGACSRMDEIEGKVLREVESVLDKFKEGMNNCVKDMVSALCKNYFGAHEVSNMFSLQFRMTFQVQKIIQLP